MTVNKFKIENCMIDIQKINTTSAPNTISPGGSSLEDEGNRIIKEYIITEQKNPK